MSGNELENLVATGALKRGVASPREVHGLINSGNARLEDATRGGLAPASRFDLAYNAAHAFALAALRHAGYRSDNRYVVFQVLPHTLALGPRVWRVLARAHDVRNMFEYEGMTVVDPRLLDDVIVAAAEVQRAVVETIGILPDR